jgi:hypothetical protein
MLLHQLFFFTVLQNIKTHTCDIQEFLWTRMSNRSYHGSILNIYRGLQLLVTLLDFGFWFGTPMIGWPDPCSDWKKKKDFIWMSWMSSELLSTTFQKEVQVSGSSFGHVLKRYWIVHVKNNEQCVMWMHNTLLSQNICMVLILVICGCCQNAWSHFDLWVNDINGM